MVMLLESKSFKYLYSHSLQSQILQRAFFISCDYFPVSHLLHKPDICPQSYFLFVLNRKYDFFWLAFNFYFASPLKFPYHSSLLASSYIPFNTVLMEKDTDFSESRLNQSKLMFVVINISNSNNYYQEQFNILFMGLKNISNSLPKFL